MHGRSSSAAYAVLTPRLAPPPACASQAYISRARVDSFSLTADLMYVSANAPRIARALFEICLRRGWSSAAELCLTLSKVRVLCLSRTNRLDLGSRGWEGNGAAPAPRSSAWPCQR